MDDPTPSGDLSLSSIQSGLSSQGVGADQITTTAAADFLMIAPPGISVGDIRAFLKGTLAELGDVWDILPDSLPVDGVRLSSLNFSPATAGEPMYLDFTVDWPTADWEMIAGILSLSSPSIDVHVIGKTAPDGRTLVSGAVAGVVKVSQVPIFIQVELPDGTFLAHLVTAGEPGTDGSPPPPSASSLLQAFQVGGDKPKAEDGGGVDLGVLTLNDLTVVGSMPARRVLFHLALGNIPVGPGDLNTQLTIDYFGGPDAQLSGQVWGQYDILQKGSDDTLFSIMLAAAYDGPGQSWKLEGGATSGRTDPVTIKELIEAFSDVEGIPDLFNDLGIKYLHLLYESGPGNFEFQCDVEVEHLFGENANVEMIVDVRLHKVGSDEGEPAEKTGDDAGAPEKTDGAAEAPAEKTGDGKNTPAQYEKTFSGRLLFNLPDDLVLEFDLLFDQSPTSTTFIAAYKNPTGGDINIGDLISQIDSNIDLPLSIKLQDAFFVYDSRAAQDNGKIPPRSSYLFGLDIGGGIDLSALPLVGKVLPADTSLTFDLQPLVALGKPDPATGFYFSVEELARLAALVPGGGITLPAVAIKESVELGINLSLGAGLTFHFDLPIKLNSKTQPKQVAAPAPAEEEPPAEDAPAPAPAPPEAPELNPPAESALATTDKPPTTAPAAGGVTPPPANSSAGGIQWIAISKAFGPVQLNRVGLQFESDQKMVWAYLDAGLSIGPLTFTLDGLGMGTPINKLAPQFRLLGIGLDYKSGPVEIGASFLRLRIPEAKDANGNVTPAYDEYSGLAIIKTPAFGLSAIGSYSDLPEYKSLFIYAVLNAPIGGPSFFFVTGLAAGFGFNRAITMPAVGAVGQFPLVNMAVGGAGSQPPADSSGRGAYINAILDQLRGSIYPMKGQYFLAAGIHFTSFEQIDSFVLLVVTFGNHFEIDVLGLSTLKVPAPVPGGAEVTSVAEVQLALKAVFNPSEGFLSVEAQLTANSYILDRKCHLTGGFAFYVWFGGPHQGDFVLSLGGYHPDFQKPDYYPTVPRLGLNWQVTSELSIMGSIYFALTPHMVMVGGRLEAVFQSGSLKASFTLTADFLICWKPYHYDAQVSLDISVEYTFNFFGTHHINANLNAQLHIWGPEFAGHAHVHLVCVTFDIDFGAATTPKLEPITWDAFRQSFLPGDSSKLATTSVMDGLLRKDQLGAGEQYVINARDFRLGVDLVVPYNALQLGGRAVSVAQVRPETVRGSTRLAAFREQADGSFAPEAGDGAIASGAFGIAPMDRSPQQVTSTFQLAAEMEENGAWQPANQHFAFRPVRKQVPRALWGEKLQPDLNGQRTIDNVLSGMEVVPAAPPQPGQTQWIARDDLQYTTTHVEAGIGFEPITAFQAASLGPDEDATGYLRAHLTDSVTMGNRRQMLTALGFDYDRLGLQLMPGIIDALVMAPQIGDLA